MADPKRKTDTALRTPGPKKKFGLVVPPPLKMPHDELIPTAYKPIEEQDIISTSQTSQTSPTTTTSQTSQTKTQTGAASQADLSTFSAIEHSTGEASSAIPSQTSQTSQTRLPSHSQTTQQATLLKSPVAPERDFTRVANSITREAVPAGVFRGKSKLLYDCLYRMTRGAVVPSRTVRISRPKLMKAAGIGSRITFDANIGHLCKVGLVEVKSIAGEHDGNEYTVYIPEERNLTMASMTGQTSQTSSGHELDRLVSLETSQTSHTLSQTISTTLPVPNTSFDTTTDDDDGISGFAEVIRVTSVAVIGHNLPKSDVERERWKELAGLLSEELKQAAERAGHISSVPAFFAAHLRRRLKTGLSVTSAANEPRPDPQVVKGQAASLSKEQRLLKMIKELHLLHVGDPDYQEPDLIDDLKYRCQKAGLSWDEEMVRLLLKPTDEGGREQES